MSLLSVTVKRARYISGQAQQFNTYVTLKLQNVKSTTVTVKGPSPAWEQDFLFETNNFNTGLLIEVWCKGMIWDKALGYNYIPLRGIRFSNEEGAGEWVSIDAEIVMRDGEVIGTKTPTGDSLLIECRFELPFGRYDPPSGWKVLLEPKSERSAPRSVGEEDNTDWLPLGQKNSSDDWSRGDVENAGSEALQRKLEKLNSAIMGQDEQSRKQHQFHGHSGYSEDSDYTSDLNYPIGQHANSSASQFKSAAQLMCTPQRSLETSRENSYERDDGPGHLQASHHLSPNQQGRGYASQHSYRGYNEANSDPLYYNSRPRDYKEYSRRRKNWDSEEGEGWYGDQYSGYAPNYGRSNETENRKRGEISSNLERQTSLLDDQYYSEQQYYDGTSKQQYKPYNAQNYGDYYSQTQDYQKSYGEVEEDRQWDSGGYHYAEGYGDNYQNQVNRKRSSKKLPSTGYAKTSQEEAYYTSQRPVNYEEDTVDGSRSVGATASRCKLLKQQRHSSEVYGSPANWQVTDKGSNWQGAADYTYYDDYSGANASAAAMGAVAPPPQVHKKRTLPQIRAPSRNKNSAVSLPPTPVRQLPVHVTAAGKQRTSAPVSRTASTEYEQAEMFMNEAYNENYNYAYVSTDNLPSEKYATYQTDSRTDATDQMYQASYQATGLEVEDYSSKYESGRLDNYQDVSEKYQSVAEDYQNAGAAAVADSFSNQATDDFRNEAAGDYQTQTTDDYYYSNDYSQGATAQNYYENESEKLSIQKKLPARRPNSPFVQQNTDSLESRDDELRGESFETAGDSICSSLPMQKQSVEYQPEVAEYKAEPVKEPEPPQPQPPPPQPQQQQQTNMTGVLGGLLGHVMKQAQPAQQKAQSSQQQQTQQQKQEQRPRDQTNTLTNQALAAMNVTKGFFSSITNAVNNTVQNINKQQRAQPPPPAPEENQVQRIQVTKRGSLQQEESLETHSLLKTRQNSFDSQTQEYAIPEEPECFEGKEEDYYNKNYDKENYDKETYDKENYDRENYDKENEYYDYGEKGYDEKNYNDKDYNDKGYNDKEYNAKEYEEKGYVQKEYVEEEYVEKDYEREYYENEESRYVDEKEVEIKDEMSQKREGEMTAAAAAAARRQNHLRHQDSIEAEVKRIETNKRLYRQQDSLDSCAEEMVIHSVTIHGDRMGLDADILDRYEVNERTGVPELIRTDSLDSGHGNRLSRDNSLIEPYHPPPNQEPIKHYSPSPPVMQNQQSLDLIGVDGLMAQGLIAMSDDKSKGVSFGDEEIQPTIQIIMPERRKMTARERWHRAYNMIVQQLNVSARQYSSLFLSELGARKKK